MMILGLETVIESTLNDLTAEALDQLDAISNDDDRARNLKRRGIIYHAIEAAYAMGRYDAGDDDYFDEDDYTGDDDDE